MGGAKFWREIFLPLISMLNGISDSLGLSKAKI
jgi:hypothetical protein